jgi:glutamate synthase domain-containing protein 1
MLAASTPPGSAGRFNRRKGSRLMCGIVGIYIKNPDMRDRLGQCFRPMLSEMTDRGPDSAGIAVYRHDGDASKLSVFHPQPHVNWTAIGEEMSDALGAHVAVSPIASHAVFRSTLDASAMAAWIEDAHPEARVMSAGHTLEIYKEVGLADAVMERFGVAQMSGSHAIGHTRMATESAVTTDGAHPFSTGEDLCLVHNGSLSNHNRLREWLRDKKGIPFKTENDTEVAAGYLTWRLREGATITEALKAGLKDFDGFYTFAVGTADGFSVLRDPIACKPAVIAETDDWVAMSSEFRALAALPGIDAATVFEPKPATIYSWGAHAGTH